jgi:hypothetical protein
MARLVARLDAPGASRIFVAAAKKRIFRRPPGRYAKSRSQAVSIRGSFAQLPKGRARPPCRAVGRRARWPRRRPASGRRQRPSELPALRGDSPRPRRRPRRWPCRSGRRRRVRAGRIGSPVAALNRPLGLGARECRRGARPGRMLEGARSRSRSPTTARGCSVSLRLPEFCVAILGALGPATVTNLAAPERVVRGTRPVTGVLTREPGRDVAKGKSLSSLQPDGGAIVMADQSDTAEVGTPPHREVHTVRLANAHPVGGRQRRSLEAQSVEARVLGAPEQHAIDRQPQANPPLGGGISRLAAPLGHASDFPGEREADQSGECREGTAGTFPVPWRRTGCRFLRFMASPDGRVWSGGRPTDDSPGAASLSLRRRHSLGRRAPAPAFPLFMPGL